MTKIEILRMQCQLLKLNAKSKHSEKSIKDAYRRASQESHPDKGGSHDDFIEVKNAYEDILNYFLIHGTLSDIFDDDYIVLVFKIHLRDSWLPTTGFDEYEGRLYRYDIEKYPQDGMYYGTSNDSIFLKIELVEDDITKKYDNDIVKSYHIDYLRLLGGCVIEVTDLENRKIEVTIPALTNPSTMFRIVNKGYGVTDRGDLLIQLVPFMPYLDEEVLDKVKEAVCLLETQF